MKPVVFSLMSFHALCLSLWIGLTTAAGAESLTLAVSRTPLSLPLYIAQSNGYFAAEGLEVKINECLGGHRCLRQVLDGQADVATTGELPVVMNSFSSSDYAVIGTFTKSSDDIKLVTNARAGIRAPAQLVGKRVGAIKGTASEFFLELYLLTAGLDPQSLSIVDVQPEDMVQALQSGKVDAISVWQPFGYQALKAMGAGATLLPSNNAYIQTFNLVSHRKLVGTRDTTLTKLLTAVERAERFIQEHPADAKRLLMQRLALEQDFVDSVWPGLRYRLVLDQALLVTMEGEARWARREGHAVGPLKPNFLQLVHSAPLHTVKPDAVATLR
ncbi:ABC transporter substrate-binding protein [Rhodoferax saidenbachensis]|uniref:NitT/TauT family transport system substrate-binding protein n=1 Tax=Rhodoferax saidenbachensis TaxID=1484693 RepID=A0ABU1ZIV1_9BURK|nr:ABC transporter substrate-binding protein [Rhodoferax saidenbachensis]MDR7304825.1 NitT/TauT family transport system substrate-binding protein [Rhodoferax saidenbachensis]